MSEVEEAAGTVETPESSQTAEPEAESGAPQNEPEASEAAVGAGEDLSKVRELVLKAHPDAVPELVQGSSVDELLASVEPARTAYQRIAEAVRGGQGVATADAASAAVVAPPAVPAGGASNVIDPSSLAPTTKIAKGLAERNRT